MAPRRRPSTTASTPSGGNAASTSAVGPMAAILSSQTTRLACSSTRSRGSTVRANSRLRMSVVATIDYGEDSPGSSTRGCPLFTTDASLASLALRRLEPDLRVDECVRLHLCCLEVRVVRVEPLGCVDRLQQIDDLLHSLLVEVAESAVRPVLHDAEPALLLRVPRVACARLDPEGLQVGDDLDELLVHRLRLAHVI